MPYLKIQDIDKTIEDTEVSPFLKNKDTENPDTEKSDTQKQDTNNINSSNTNSIDNYQSINQKERKPDPKKENDEFNLPYKDIGIEQIIENCQLDKFKSTIYEDIAQVIRFSIIDMYYQGLTVNRKPVSVEWTRYKLNQVNEFHIQYAIDCFTNYIKNNDIEIKNYKGY